VKLLAFALLLLAEPSRAEPRDDLARGLAELNGGEFEAARTTLLRATRSLRDPRALARAHLHLGVCQALLGDEGAARRSFAAALERDPWIRPDPERVKPALVALFTEVLARRRGELVVNADAPDLAVLLDGRAVGRTPYLGELPAGRYRLEVRSPDGALRHVEGVTVAAGRKTTVQIRLARTAAVRRAAAPAAGGSREPGRYRATLILGVATLAVGAAALGTGIAAQLASADFASQKEAYLAATDLAQARGLEEELRASKTAAESRALATNVLLATTGGLALGTAVAFLVARLRAPGPEQPRVQVLVAPGAGGLQVRGGF
jgi:hypothetical protein